GYTVNDWRREPIGDSPYRGRLIITDPFRMLSDLHSVMRWVAFDFDLSARAGNVDRVERLLPLLVHLSRIYDPISIGICQHFKAATGGFVARWVLEETSNSGVDRIGDIEAVNACLD